MPATMTRWITVDEMRDRLSISKNKAYQLANDGSLETVKIGRSLRVSEESLNRWLEGLNQSGKRGGREMA